MASSRPIFHVLATGTLWEEVFVEPGRSAGDLRFIAVFADQPAALAEARRRASLAAPATIYIMADDGESSEVIHIEAGP